MYHANGNDDVSLRTEQCYPVLSLGKGAQVHQVRWNNDDRAALPIRYDNQLASDVWYDAARKWVEIIRSPECEYWEQLKPGRPLIFDNWRVLHGRSAFSGKRRLCGGYINNDDYLSRTRVLNMKREENMLWI